MAQVRMLIYLLFLLYFCFIPMGPRCKTYLDVKLCNNVLYSVIFSYILITIDDVTSCMYCGLHVGAPDLLLKPGVTGGSDNVEGLSPSSLKRMSRAHLEYSFSSEVSSWFIDVSSEETSVSSSSSSSDGS
jgi:hypothetical protein